MTWISLLTRLLPWQLWAALAALVALAATGWYINDRAYSRGFSEADSQWVALVEAETGRQREVNADAQEWAREEVARLQSAKEDRDALLEELDAAAAADPDAGNVCLGPDSVMRLNFGDGPEANP